MEERSFILFILFIISSGITVLGDCPAGWTRHNNKCYYLSASRHNYVTSVQMCAKHNATLASFSSNDEWNFIKSMLSSGPRTMYYSGLIYNTTGKRWQWNNGTPYNKTLAHWYRYIQTIPSATQLRSHFTCSYMYGYAPYTGQIFLTTCYSSYPCICQRSADTYDLCNEDDGWKDLYGKCFKFFQTKSTWYDARTTCQQDGGLLPSPQNNLELLLSGDLVDCTTTKDNNIWTDFTDQYSPGIYKSADTNQTMRYQAWASNVNTSPRGNTCIMSVPSMNFLFSRDSCINERKFICVKPHGTCPSGFITSANKCYQVHSTPASQTSWFMANDICKKQGLQLLTVEDAQTQNLVYGVLSRLHMYDAWLAISDRHQDGNYTWEDGTSLNVTSSYRHWYTNYPRSIPGLTDCGIINGRSGAYWTNGYCYMSKSFICQMPITQKYVNHTQPANNVSCPHNWKLFRQDCYFTGPVMTWDQARQYCKRANADLTTIRDELEQSYITNTLSISYAWIGLRRDRRTTNSDFMWVDNTPVTFNNFGPGQPMDRKYNMDCVDARYHLIAYPGTWETKNNCNFRRNFICRAPAIGATPSPATGNTIPWSYRCGPNWIINAMEGSCYQVVVGATKNWIDARADCLRNHADLVSIDGPKEQTFIQAVLSTGQYANVQDWFWIGATDRNGEGGWTWCNRAPFRYINWHEGEPNAKDGDEDCVQMIPHWNYQWNDKMCSVLNNYICEKAAAPESTISPAVTQPTQAGKGPCRAEPMISGTYSLPYGQGALQAQSSRDPSHGAEASRIATSNNASWSAASTTQNQWISATFYNIIITRAIRIAGRHDTNEWVTKFKLMYQYDYFSPWYTYQDPPGTDKVLNANTDSSRVIQVNLNFPIEAKSIKLIPTAWHGGISLKWEIMGCIEEDCYAEYGVSGPLFVQDGGFTSSSILDPQHSPHDSRLHSNSPNYIPSCWKPKTTDKNAWLEIDLGSVKVIRGVTTAGNPAAQEFVMNYQVTYKLEDGSNRYFVYQQPYGKTFTFPGNRNNGTFVTNLMKSHFQAQHVRIVVTKFHTAIALRVDLLVCPITCREIPLINGPQKVSDNQLKASSTLNSEHGAQRSRLNQPAQGDYSGGWEAEYNDKNQYIQVDLGRVVEVTAVSTQGRDDRNQFVRSYTIAYSTDGTHWYPYYEGTTVHVFDGNWDSKTVRKHYLMIPMNVRFVRLWPRDWQDRIAMRWELYGCPGPMAGTAIGCYGDSKSDRDLPYEPLTDPAAGVWPPSCIHHCYLKGYFYAGLQNGFECFCGNSYGKYGPASNCSLPCFPHPAMKCGGPLANYIHSTGLSFEKICQPGMKGYNDDCYMVMNDLKSWSDARKQCQTIGGDLASIDDQNQQNFVYSLMTKGGDDVWIGLNDLQEMMFYEWSNQRPVKFTNWNINEPSNMPGKNEDCVKVNFKTAGWMDETCDNKHKYVCQAPKTPTTIPTVPPVIEGCEMGWDGFRWSCYLYIKQARTWSDASNVCASFGATLVRIDDRFEQSYLASALAKNKTQYWTDISDNQKTGTYMYSDGITGVSLTNWAKDKPDQNGHCVAMGTGVNAGLWYNLFCNSTLLAVCEKLRVGYTVPATLPPTSPTTPCPKDWIDEGEYCYQVNNNPINRQLAWNDAKLDCQKQNADLASFHNASALDNLWRNYIAGGTDHFWIGLNNIQGGGKGGYQWTDKSPVDFTNWGVNEPNNQNGDEQCVEVFVQYGRFNDQSCWRMRNWICGIKKGTMARPRTTMPVPTAGKPGSCGSLPDEWKMYNNYCYMAQDGTGDKAKTWRQAHLWCHNMGAELVSIGDIREQLFVQNLVSNLSDVHVWIGFNELDWEYGYRWSDGSPTKFIYWNTNEPNDFKGSESCGDMTVYNGKWNDEHCSTTQGYVCKKNFGPMKPPITQPPVMPGYCPTGFATFGNRCFKVNTAVQDWAKARKVCKGQGRGYDLASIQNAREQAFVTTLLINSKVNMWIGMYKTQIQTAINLRWAFNDDPMQYTNWATNEPNGEMKESCVMLYTQPDLAGRWNDDSCTTPMGSICETFRKPYIKHPEAIPNPCNAGQGWKPLGKDCFKLFTPPKTWTDARAACLSQGASLTSINTPYEQAMVFLLATDNGSSAPIWIGLNDVKKQGKYSWVDNWPVLFTNWGSDEPSRGPNEGCVLFDPIQGFWSDDDCLKPLNFACRITTAQPSFTPATPNGQCPGDEWEAFGNNCYMFKSTKQMKFSDAVFQCEELRGNLVSIHDNTTNQYILSRVQVQTSFGVWLGLHKSKDSGFSWRDNSAVGYVNWASNQPSVVDGNGIAEQCVEMYAQTGLWNDVSCDTFTGLVCERPQVHDTNLQTFPSIPVQRVNTTPRPPTLPSQEIPTPHGVGRVTTRPTNAPRTKLPTQNPTGKATLNPFQTPKLRTSLAPKPMSTGLNQHSSPARILATPSPGVSGGGIAAIVLGVIVVIIVAVIVTVLIMRKRSSKGYSMYESGGTSFGNALYDTTNASG